MNSFRPDFASSIWKYLLCFFVALELESWYTERTFIASNQIDVNLRNSLN